MKRRPISYYYSSINIVSACIPETKCKMDIVGSPSLELQFHSTHHIMNRSYILYGCGWRAWISFIPPPTQPSSLSDGHFCFLCHTALPSDESSAAIIVPLELLNIFRKICKREIELEKTAFPFYDINLYFFDWIVFNPQCYETSRGVEYRMTNSRQSYGTRTNSSFLFAHCCKNKWIIRSRQKNKMFQLVLKDTKKIVQIGAVCWVWEYTHVHPRLHTIVIYFNSVIEWLFTKRIHLCSLARKNCPLADKPFSSVAELSRTNKRMS